METVKKGRGTGRPNGSRTVNAYLANGNLVGSEAQSKWSAHEVWDISYYNFQTKKWESEGESLRNYRQAYARASYLGRQNPYCKVAVTLVPSATKKVLRKRDVAPAAEAV